MFWLQNQYPKKGTGHFPRHHVFPFATTFDAESDLSPFAVPFLSGELDAVGQELFVAVEIDIVLGADVLFQPRSFTQHQC